MYDKLTLDMVKANGTAPNPFYNSTLAEAKKVQAFLKSIPFGNVGDIVVHVDFPTMPRTEIPISAVSPQPPEDLPLFYGVQFGGEGMREPVIEKSTHIVSLVLSTIKAWGGNPAPFVKEFVGRYSGGDYSKYASLWSNESTVNDLLMELWRKA